MTTQPQIFISYSHEDKNFLEELLVHIKPLEAKFDFSVWSDSRLEPGASWEKEIKAALANVDIAILLISAHYLASDFIKDIELPKLLKRSETGEVRVIPIVVRPSPWAHTPLAYFQSLPRDGRSFSELGDVERDQAWLTLYEVLEAELHNLSEGKEDFQRTRRPRTATPETETVEANGDDGMQTEARTPSEDSRPKFFISHAKEDGDFAENLKGRMREEKLDGWIDIDVLEAGVDWRKEIDEAILSSPALVLVLSPDSKNSEYVTYEWAFALGSGLRIVPLMLRDTSIHPRLEVFQYLDFTNRRARPWNRLFSLLNDVVELAPENELTENDDPWDALPETDR